MMSLMQAVLCGGRVALNSLICPHRTIATTSILCRTQAGKHRTTRKKTKALTYEMAQKPDMIGLRKSWLSWHTQDLADFGQRPQKTVAEDEIIRRFIRGTWFRIFASELIIKRRGNLVVISGIIFPGAKSARTIYWLIGYTEEFLSFLLKQPVRLELQSIANKKDIDFKYV